MTTALPTIYVGIESGKADHGSPQDQLKRIGEHPAAQADGRFCVGQFSESGKSGYRSERGPELAAAIELAKSAATEHGEAELWVFHSSRLARGDGRRGQRSLMKIWSDCLYADVQIRSVEDDEFVLNPMLVGVASTQNHKYSADLSSHIRRGKAAQWEKGRRLGGRVRDGYHAIRERSENGRIVRIDYDFDPARKPTIDRLFALALSGTTATQVGRKLNDEHLLTRHGKPWTTRGVVEVLCHAFYAGQIQRKLEDGTVEVKTGEGQHPAYISVEQSERFRADHADRKTGKRGPRKVGAPVRRHLLDGGEGGLGGCLRCGGKITPGVSGHKRKDGSRRIFYECVTARQNGTCDAGQIDALMVDGPLLESLDGLFIDFDAWLSSVTTDTEAATSTIEADLDRLRQVVIKAKGKETLLAGRYAEHAGEDDVLAAADAAAMKQQAQVREDAEGRASALEEALAAAQTVNPVDVALDTFNQLSGAVRTALGCKELIDVREGLRPIFERFWIDKRDNGQIEILPALRTDAGLRLVQDQDGGVHLGSQIYVEGDDGSKPVPDDIPIPDELAQQLIRNPTPIPVLVDPALRKTRGTL